MDPARKDFVRLKVLAPCGVYDVVCKSTYPFCTQKCVDWQHNSQMCVGGTLASGKGFRVDRLCHKLWKTIKTGFESAFQELNYALGNLKAAVKLGLE